MALDTPLAVSTISLLGSTYPIYGTFDRAREYHNGSLTGATFTDAEFTLQNQALVMARRWLDRQTYTGSKTGGDSQTTQFPRDGDTTVPLGVEFAEYELAAVLLDDATAFAKENTGSNEKRLKAGSVEIEFFSRTSGSASVFPPQALDHLAPYLASKAALVIPYVGGLGNSSSVLGLDQFGLIEPL